MQLKNIHIMLISLVFAFLHMQLYGVKQLQESSIHPVWYITNAGKSLSKDEKIDQFRTVCNQLGVTENAKIPDKSSTFVRVATYNVHFWRNPYATWNTQLYDFNKIIEVIRVVNADILILQEVGGGPEDWLKTVAMKFKEMGYTSYACASTSEKGVNQPGHLYNCIYSKYPFVEQPIKKQFATNPDLKIPQNHEQRCFVGVRIKLPNDKMVSVYGTHLEVRPIIAKSPDGKGRGMTPDTARKEQIQELVAYIQQHDTTDNIIIGADFNTFRKQDLLNYRIKNKTLWEILQKDWANILKVSDIPKGMEHLADKAPSTLALDYLEAQGYRDSFTVGGFSLPQFSVWTGTLIDFLFLSKTWDLPLQGCYAFYNWASDHIPVIMDIGE